MSDGSLLAAALEATRAIHMAQEAESEAQASDEGHGLPSHAQSRCTEASHALSRAAKRLEGEAFRLERAARHYGSQDDWEAA